jgi:hypothetical protein
MSAVIHSFYHSVIQSLMNMDTKSLIELFVGWGILITSLALAAIRWYQDRKQAPQPPKGE